MDIAEAVPALLAEHPAVASVRLTGSRAAGTAHELSDWDFLVEANAFETVAGDLPELLEPLHPLAAQWDRYSDHACYMLMLRGPTKVDLIFPHERQRWAPPWEVSAESLGAIDRHFWDWILWLEQKRRSGEELTHRLADLHKLLLGPMGAREPPASVSEALDSYLSLRGRLEKRFGVSVPPELEAEVRPAIVRGG
jgi:hypothetical protein